MSRRQYRQVKSQEAFITGTILVAILVTVTISTIPQSEIFHLAIAIVFLIIAGSLLYYLLIYRKGIMYRKGLRQLIIDDVDRMSGVEFERYVAHLFREQGYRVKNTAASGDYGVDLIISKKGVRTAVQTKRYSKSVSQTAVREAVAGMKSYNCTQSMVVTNSHFTPFAQNLATDNNCILIDREELIRMIATNPSITEKEFSAEV